ncbi:hypothetical protein CYMTET_50562 [Cymbomonas tetramitiformis]|uniref:EF-hand domain-containing protein n=1 Tax=Cymbomonas tetramitiformis TaxID=36881 RepID=A0AAE0BMS9_9CHLO|nr:hypothetical protein CYMTET_50562 [Cymbomonas tetramitiformis]
MSEFELVREKAIVQVAVASGDISGTAESLMRKRLAENSKETDEERRQWERKGAVAYDKNLATLLPYLKKRGIVTVRFNASGEVISVRRHTPRKVPGEVALIIADDGACTFGNHGSLSSVQVMVMRLMQEDLKKLIKVLHQAAETNQQMESYDNVLSAGGPSAAALPSSEARQAAAGAHDGEAASAKDARPSPHKGKKGRAKKAAAALAEAASDSAAEARRLSGAASSPSAQEASASPLSLQAEPTLSPAPPGPQTLANAKAVAERYKGGMCEMDEAQLRELPFSQRMRIQSHQEQLRNLQERFGRLPSASDVKKLIDKQEALHIEWPHKLKSGGWPNGSPSDAIQEQLEEEEEEPTLTFEQVLAEEKEKIAQEEAAAAEVRELSLGGKDPYFEAAKYSEKLSKIVVVLKNEFSSAGLDLSSFDLDDLVKAVIPKVNELLYDTLAYVVKTDSAAEHFRLLGTDSRLVRDNRSEDWTPTESTRKYKLYERLDPEFYAAARVRYPMPADLRPVPLSTLTNLVTRIFVAWEQQQAELGVAAGPGIAGAAYSGVDERVLEVLGLLTSRLEKIEAAIKFQKTGDEAMCTLALCQIFQVAADDGSDAFAAAVAEYGPPAVLAGGESDDIDVSAYDFTVAGSSSGVLSELEALTGQVVPPAGGASAGGALTTGGYMVHVHPATEEFPGGVEMIPPTAVPPSDYWRAEGYYITPHDPHTWTWHPGPSYPQVVVPYLGPWGTFLGPDWDGVLSCGEGVTGVRVITSAGARAGAFCAPGAGVLPLYCGEGMTGRASHVHETHTDVKGKFSPGRRTALRAEERKMLKSAKKAPKSPKSSSTQHTKSSSPQLVDGKPGLRPEKRASCARKQPAKKQPGESLQMEPSSESKPRGHGGSTQPAAGSSSPLKFVEPHGRPIASRPSSAPPPACWVWPSPGPAPGRVGPPPDNALSAHCLPSRCPLWASVGPCKGASPQAYAWPEAQPSAWHRGGCAERGGAVSKHGFEQGIEMWCDSRQGWGGGGALDGVLQQTDTVSEELERAEQVYARRVGVVLGAGMYRVAQSSPVHAAPGLHLMQRGQPARRYPGLDGGYHTEERSNIRIPITYSLGKTESAYVETYIENARQWKLLKRERQSPLHAHLQQHVQQVACTAADQAHAGGDLSAAPPEPALVHVTMPSKEAARARQRQKAAASSQATSPQWNCTTQVAGSRSTATFDLFPKRAKKPARAHPEGREHEGGATPPRRPLADPRTGEAADHPVPMALGVLTDLSPGLSVLPPPVASPTMHADGCCSPVQPSYATSPSILSPLPTPCDEVAAHHAIAGAADGEVELTPPPSQVPHPQGPSSTHHHHHHHRRDAARGAPPQPHPETGASQPAAPSCTRMQVEDAVAPLARDSSPNVHVDALLGALPARGQGVGRHDTADSHGAEQGQRPKAGGLKTLRRSSEGLPGGLSPSSSQNSMSSAEANELSVLGSTRRGVSEASGRRPASAAGSAARPRSVRGRAAERHGTQHAEVVVRVWMHDDAEPGTGQQLSTIKHGTPAGKKKASRQSPSVPVLNVTLGKKASAPHVPQAGRVAQETSFQSLQSNAESWSPPLPVQSPTSSQSMPAPPSAPAHPAPAEGPPAAPASSPPVQPRVTAPSPSPSPSASPSPSPSMRTSLEADDASQPETASPLPSATSPSAMIPASKSQSPSASPTAPAPSSPSSQKTTSPPQSSDTSVKCPQTYTEQYIRRNQSRSPRSDTPVVDLEEVMHKGRIYLVEYNSGSIFFKAREGKRYEYAGCVENGTLVIERPLDLFERIIEYCLDQKLALEELIAQIDWQSKGHLDASEVTRLLKMVLPEHIVASKLRMRYLQLMLDLNGDGTLSMKDLIEIMRGYKAIGGTLRCWPRIELADMLHKLAAFMITEQACPAHPTAPLSEHPSSARP